MQCSTRDVTEQSKGLMDIVLGGPASWVALLRSVPGLEDLEATARSSGALIRHRGVKSAADLLRLDMAYSVCDWSLSMVGGWCTLLEMGGLSKTAVRNRLRGSVRWLGRLIGSVLKARHLRLESQPGVRVRILDATVVSEPGSRGTDWRVHLSLDLGLACVAGMELTDAHGGETLARFPVEAGEIRVADRGHAFPKGMGPVLAAGGGVVVRMSWQNLRLEDEAGQRVDVVEWLTRLQVPGVPHVNERMVWLRTPEGHFAVRVIALRLPDDKVAQARRRAREKANKNGHSVHPGTLLSAGFVLVLTNLPQASWPAERVMELYRIRWQVEILIKRFKSVFVLDGLRAQNRELAQAYLLGKLLGVLLEEEMMHTVTTCHSDWLTDPSRPLSFWPLSKMCWQILASLIRGPLTLDAILTAGPELRRFLCDAPRKRRPQWMQARALLVGTSGG